VSDIRIMFLYPRLIMRFMCSTIFFTAEFSNAAIIYVHASAGLGNQDGTTWRHAYRNLREAMEAATFGDQLWVAKGIYWTGSDENSTFQLKNGVEIYGGFPLSTGDEGNFDLRDAENGLSVLSGDIDQDDLRDRDGIVSDTDDVVGRNSYHVVTASDTDATAVLDGFVITAGQADGTGEIGRGGGLYNDGGNATLRNIRFIGNFASEYGGGFFDRNVSDLTFDHLTFTGNKTAGDGGGMFSSNTSNLLLSHTTFSGNTAGNSGGGLAAVEDINTTFQNVIFAGNLAKAGGGLANKNSFPILTNVALYGNEASESGGGMMNFNSSPRLINSVFSGNSTEGLGGGMGNAGNSSPSLINITLFANTATVGGGGISNIDQSEPTLQNCVLWANSSDGPGNQMYNMGISSDPSINSSLVQGGCPDELTICQKIIDADPLFVDPDGHDNVVGTPDDDLRLRHGSPALDMGTDSSVPEGVSTDLTAHPRFSDGNGDGTATIDMGANESPPPIVYVKDDAGGANTGFNWTDALSDLNDALSYSIPDTQVWVAAGIYVPGSSSRAPFNLSTASRFTVALRESLELRTNLRCGISIRLLRCSVVTKEETMLRANPVWSQIRLTLWAQIVSM